MLLFTFLDESICRFSSFFCPHTSSSARFACLHFTQASCAHYYFWSNSFAVLMNVQKLKEQKARADCVVGWVHKGQRSRVTKTGGQTDYMIVFKTVFTRVLSQVTPRIHRQFSCSSRIMAINQGKLKYLG